MLSCDQVIEFAKCRARRLRAERSAQRRKSSMTKLAIRRSRSRRARGKGLSKPSGAPMPGTFAPARNLLGKPGSLSDGCNQVRMLPPRKRVKTTG